MSRAIACIMLAVLLAGCGPSASKGEFDSDNPAAKLYAIREAGERRDPKDIPRLVELLDHDDPAVRMFSIQALEKITGTRLGYNPYASVADRRKAIEAWEEAAKSHRFDAHVRAEDKETR